MKASQLPGPQRAVSEAMRIVGPIDTYEVAHEAARQGFRDGVTVGRRSMYPYLFITVVLAILRWIV
jgi:hypothetical protein